MAVHNNFMILVSNEITNIIQQEKQNLYFHYLQIYMLCVIRFRNYLYKVLYLGLNDGIFIQDTSVGQQNICKIFFCHTMSKAKPAAREHKLVLVNNNE